MDQNPSPGVDTVTPAPSAAPGPEKLSFTLDEWEAELAQAEQKGYLRGRNSRITELSARPGIFENATVDTIEQRLASDSSFLAHRRPSIWD